MPVPIGQETLPCPIGTYRLNSRFHAVTLSVKFAVFRKKRTLRRNFVKSVIFTNFNAFDFICEGLQTVINMLFLYRFCEVFKDCERTNRVSVMTSCIRRSSVTDTIARDDKLAMYLN